MKRFRSVGQVLFSAALLAGSVAGATAPVAAQQVETAAGAPQAVDVRPSIYWGAYVPDWPADTLEPIQAFEQTAGKKVSMIQWGSPWVIQDNYVPFPGKYFDLVRSHGAIPMLDWGAQDLAVRGGEQPNFALARIIEGSHDWYIRLWAQQAKQWGHPFFLRLNPEMNGWWLPWSEQINGNQPGEYVQAWRHVVDIFRQEGVSNVTWVWCPNIVGQYSTPLEGLFPGNDYVDWTCMDGYNWGTDNGNSGWWSLTDVFSGSEYTGYFNTYQQLLDLAPGKPVMIGETASSENGGSKAAWIRAALTKELQTNFPRVQAFVWFNSNNNDPALTWPVDSSPQARAAFAEAIAGPMFATSSYGSLATSPIPPPDQVVLPPTAPKP